MKGVILGIGLFLGGIIGFVGFIIASAITHGTLISSHIGTLDYLLLLAFAFMVLFGLIIAITDYIMKDKEQNKHD